MPDDEEQRLYQLGERYRLPAGNEAAVSPWESKSFQKKILRIARQKEMKKQKQLAKAAATGVDQSKPITAVSPQHIVERYLNSRKQKQVQKSGLF